MEKLQNFVITSNITSSFNYYQKAKDYIDKAVYNLSLTLKQGNTVQAQTERKENLIKTEIIEIDEKTADIKYREGLSLYAKGKYFEAERMWELTLRLNPNHIKAQTALAHIRNKNTK
jgi:tetratricopeptide (TPR) repeat protein